MSNSILAALLALLLGALADPVQAQPPTLPEAERTAEAKRWLAIAFVAEAGWLKDMDHRGIYHVLRRRWTRRVKIRPKLRFIRAVQLYVAIFDPRTKKGKRARWLLSLRPGEDRAPAGWPRKLDWPKHKKLWDAAQERAARCIDGGRCKDPYPKAKHWGGDMDSPKSCMIELPNVGTSNTFYDTDSACMRKKARKKRESQKRRKRRSRVKNG